MVPPSTVRRAGGVGSPNRRRRGLRRGRRWVAALAACAALSAGPAWARDDQPLRIPLEPMGYQAMTQELLLAGNSMLTVDFVDNTHLLITFAVRRLMKREADTQPADDDRTIGAFLVELPSGKVLARTEWRVHDRLQYVWNLGQGRFLLRVRDRLSVIAPLADPKDAFRELPVVRGDRHIIAIQVSSNDDLLTLYTVKPPLEGGAVLMGDAAQPDPAPVQISFFRMSNSGDPTGGLHLTPAGALRTREASALPMTTGGYLDVIDGGHGTWLFNFDEHAGKETDLLSFDTSCFPRSNFVDHSEFVVFACRGSDDRQSIAAFNLKGDELWLQNFMDTHVNPSFSFAPAAGRFALGRTLVSAPVSDDNPLAANLVTGQEVRVYQSYNGRQLFKIDSSPVERAGQNFALSPDGMQLAVVRQAMMHHVATKDDEAHTDRETSVEVYALPPLAKDDLAAISKAEAMAPADSGARIDLALERVSAADAGKAAPSSQAGDSAGSMPVLMVDGDRKPAANSGETASGGSPVPDTGTNGPADTAASAPVVEGDVQPTGPRKPPTLYAPGEKPEQKGSNKSPDNKPQ